MSKGMVWYKHATGIALIFDLIDSVFDKVFDLIDKVFMLFAYD